MILANDSTSPNSTLLKQVSIVGAGAIGQLIYHQLSTDVSASKIAVNVISRAAHSQLQPLTFTNLDNTESTQIAEFVGLNDYSQRLPETDLLIVCLKAYQVCAALKIIIPMLSTECNILLLHNGMGPHLGVAQMLNGQSLSLGTTSQAALKQSQWHTKQTGKGVTQLGTFHLPKHFKPLGTASQQKPSAQKTLSESLKNILLTAIPQSLWSEEILTMLWQKLAINVAINPLTAIHNCQNGQLAHEQYRDTIIAAVTELVKVANAEHIPLELPSVLDRVYQVITLTADNYSSMHQDVLHQRTTEIDSINGFVVQMAKRHGITTPQNQQLVDQIKCLELQYRR
ncbi:MULTISPECIES: ketopantoate reductase family protein [unclassified Shewanella]|uniref:ketopantoate reductase family protein n=1 Tax=unclassified Shewanella TaxID=196818 RepID=UPI000C7A6290|nr:MULTISPECIES: 2-dehydropantoate 2-reductase [unclassified Shewanella]PKG55091.1 2-dehydropantoate 2-reductase [Shewanella sp. GutDb-MelDb]PKG75159.1 2-dehydropantoate 2-reductase [Shewanella sp. GutCb]